MRKISFALMGLMTFVLTTSFVLQADWFLLDDPSYSILFPKKPEVQIQNVNSAAGELKMFINMYDGSKDNDENFLYGIITTDYPDSLINSDKKEKLDDFFKASVDGAVKNVQGKLLSQKVIELNGFPGREVRVDFQNGLAIIMMRSYLVHNKMFILQTITETKKEGNASALKFYDSFKLK